MTLYRRNELTKLLKRIRDGERPSALLLFGDRYLCRQAADQICEALFTTGSGTVTTIDGEQEDIGQTISRLRSFSLLPGMQIYRVTDTRIFHSRSIADRLWKRAVSAQEKNNSSLAAKHLRAMLATAELGDENLAELSPEQWKDLFSFARPTGDLGWTTKVLQKESRSQEKDRSGQSADSADQLLGTLKAGIPATNVLLLLSEVVDRRKKIFKWLQKHGVVIDLSVEKGSSSRAQKAQKAVLADLVRQTLARLDKTMASGVADILFERVGFFPVAVVMETEKLACYVGDRTEIRREDLDAVVGRSRQEALFELTGAIGRKDTEEALRLVGRLLDHGIHPLAIIATLRNFVRSLLLFRALQEQPSYQYRPGMTAHTFQQTCLPRLKKNILWQAELSGHPYALYMQFKSASSFSLHQLSAWLGLILKTERRLKGSIISPKALLQELVISMLLYRPGNGTLKKCDRALH